MKWRKASRPTAAIAAHEPRTFDLLAGINREATPEHRPFQVLPIHAELIGSDTCTAIGLTVRATAPIFAMCRQLIAAGHDPRRRLVCYRGNTLAITVKNIGIAADYTVKTTGNGAPGFALNGFLGGAAAPLVRKSWPARPLSRQLAERRRAP